MKDQSNSEYDSLFNPWAAFSPELSVLESDPASFLNGLMEGFNTSKLFPPPFSLPINECRKQWALFLPSPWRHSDGMRTSVMLPCIFTAYYVKLHTSTWWDGLRGGLKSFSEILPAVRFYKVTQTGHFVEFLCSYFFIIICYKSYDPLVNDGT